MAKDKNTSIARVETNHELSKYDPMNLVEDVNGDILAEAINTGKILPRVVSLGNGQAMRRMRVIGPGPQVESRDDMTGEIRPLDTWHLAKDAGGKTVEVYLISAYQLNKELPALVGKTVTIIRGEQKDIGTRRVNQFMVSVHD